MNLKNLNRQWHADNKMPDRPTLDQRVEWHKEHMLHCGCRGIPADIKAEIEKRNK